MEGFNIFRSLAYYLTLILGVLVLIFLLFSALPSDPARLMLGIHATEEAVERLRIELGLDKPLTTQLLSYFTNLVKLDLGISYVSRRPVAPDVFNAFKATISYAALALLISIVYSILTFVLVYFGKSKFRLFFTMINSALTSMPSLVIAIIVGVIILKINMFYFIDSITLRNLFTAAIVLSIYPACSLSQILINEGSLIQSKHFVTAGKSYGFSEFRIFRTYVLRNALLPWLAQLSNVAAMIVAGAIVVEIVFSLPGLGRLILQSVLRNDYPMIQGVVLVTSISFILLNLFMEIIYKKMFPYQMRN